MTQNSSPPPKLILRFTIIEVSRHGLDGATVLVGDGIGEIDEALPVSCHEDQVIASLCQPLGVDGADN